MEELEVGLDDTRLSEETAKIIEADDTPSESVTEESSEPKKEETPEEDSTRTDTSIKTEEKSEEPKAEVKEEVDESRFDRHPRWQQLKQERDQFKEQVASLNDLKAKLEDFEVSELTRLKEAGKLLRQNPELAEKVQKLIDSHPFGDERTRTEVSAVRSELQQMQESLALEKYDNAVERLSKEHKLNENVAALAKELLDNRVVQKKLGFKDIPMEYKSIVDNINKLSRSTLAGYVETKKTESKVPTSPTNRGKAMPAKKESSEQEDVIGEIASGLKAGRDL